MGMRYQARTSPADDGSRRMGIFKRKPKRLEVRPPKPLERELDRVLRRFDSVTNNSR